MGQEERRWRTGRLSTACHSARIDERLIQDQNRAGTGRFHRHPLQNGFWAGAARWDSLDSPKTPASDRITRKAEFLFRRHKAVLFLGPDRNHPNTREGARPAHIRENTGAPPDPPGAKHRTARSMQLGRAIGDKQLLREKPRACPPTCPSAGGTRDRDRQASACGLSPASARDSASSTRGGGPSG